MASITYAADLPIAVEDIRHFGDLDVKGLLIPTQASAVAVSAGLPPVRPASALYADLLRIGHAGDGAAVPRDRAARAAAWLAAGERDAAVDLLSGGHRIAQECWVSNGCESHAPADRLRIV